MSAIKLLDLLEELHLTSPKLIEALRKRVNAASKPMDPKAIIGFLVDKNHLSTLEADTLLTTLKKDSDEIDGVNSALVSDEEEESSSVVSSPELLAVEEASALSLVTDKEPDTKPKEPENPFTVVSSEETTSADTTKEESKPAEVSEKREPRKKTAAATVTPAEEKSSASLPAEKPLAAEVPRRKTKRKLKGAKSEWDSPLLLYGTGALVAMVLIGSALYYFFNAENGDDLFNAANEEYVMTSYSQSIPKFEKYIKDFPKHESRSIAQVKLGLARIRVVMGKPLKALEVSSKELKRIDEEKDFEIARSELAGLLPKIAKSLSDSASKETDTEKSIIFVKKAKEAIGLYKNTTYVPKSKRDPVLLSEISQSLIRVELRQQAQLELEKALNGMKKAIAEDSPKLAYKIRRDLVKKFAVLAESPELLTVTKSVSAAEQQSLSFVTTTEPAVKTERKSPVVAEVSLGYQRLVKETGVQGTRVVRAANAVYAINVANGEVLWHRTVGTGTTARFVYLTNGTVLLHDSNYGELVCVRLDSGKLVWRKELEKKIHTPTQLTDKILVATLSGKLIALELATGNQIGFIQFAQPLASAPVLGTRGDRVYLVGHHSSLYSFSAANLQCLGVYHLGHAKGSVQVDPLVIQNKLIVAENYGAETSHLHVLLLSRTVGIEKTVKVERLEGLVQGGLHKNRRILATVTDKGKTYIYEISNSAEKDSVTQVVKHASRSKEIFTSHAYLDKKSKLWIANNQLARFAISRTSRQLDGTDIGAQYEDATFTQPLQEYEGVLIHTRRPAHRAGFAVAAMDVRSGDTLWETDLAVTPAGSVFGSEAKRQFYSVSAAGQVFSIGSEAFKNRRSNQTLKNSSIGGPLSPTLGSVVKYSETQAAALTTEGSRLLLVGTGKSGNETRWVNLGGKTVHPAAKFEEGYLVTLTIGQVHYLSAKNGRRLALPYQPLLNTGKKLAWLPVVAAPSKSSKPSFVLSNGQEIYRVALQGADSGSPKLKQVAQGESIESPLVTPLVITGDKVFAGTAKGALAIFKLADLTPVKNQQLPGRVVWGPFLLGEKILLATDSDQLVYLDTSGAILWTSALEAGVPIGKPLLQSSSMLISYPQGLLGRFDLSNGNAAGVADLGQPLATGPTSLGKHLILTAQDGTLLIVEQP